MHRFQNGQYHCRSASAARIRRSLTSSPRRSLPVPFLTESFCVKNAASDPAICRATGSIVAAQYGRAGAGATEHRPQHRRRCWKRPTRSRASRETGLTGRIGHAMIPGMIARGRRPPCRDEAEARRPGLLEPDRPELPGIKGLCTQVTAFMDQPSHATGSHQTSAADMEGIVFVGVPHHERRRRFRRGPHRRAGPLPRPGTQPVAISSRPAKASPGGWSSSAIKAPPTE